jgi:hypothetical protein
MDFSGHYTLGYRQNGTAQGLQQLFHIQHHGGQQRLNVHLGQAPPSSPTQAVKVLRLAE